MLQHTAVRCKIAVGCVTALRSDTKGYRLSYKQCESLETYVFVKVASKFAWRLLLLFIIIRVCFFVILFSLLMVSFVYCVDFALLFLLFNGYFLCRILWLPLPYVIFRLNNKCRDLMYKLTDPSQEFEHCSPVSLHNLYSHLPLWISNIWRPNQHDICL